MLVLTSFCRYDKPVKIQFILRTIIFHFTELMRAAVLSVTFPLLKKTFRKYNASAIRYRNRISFSLISICLLHIFFLNIPFSKRPYK